MSTMMASLLAYLLCYTIACIADCMQGDCKVAVHLRKQCITMHGPNSGSQQPSTMMYVTQSALPADTFPPTLRCSSSVYSIVKVALSLPSVSGGTRVSL
jgi:hypothetical protein